MLDVEATFARKTGSSSACVDPSMSVNRKVTVPVGKLCMGGLLGRLKPWAAWSG